MSSFAQEGATPPHWIWSPGDASPDQIPAGTRYFRKVLDIKEPSSRLAVDVTGDDRFSLYLDGQEIARGSDWHRVKSVEARLTTGRHVLAAIVTNDAPGSAGFLLRGGVLPLGQSVPVHTDSSWRTTDQPPADEAWMKPGFDDASWSRARDLGVLGTGPWKDLVFESGDASGRFQVPAGFTIRMVAAPEVTGSVIAFSFGSDGKPCVGIEQGPIARLVDGDGDGIFEAAKPITPQMRNCQGFSFIRGHLFAVGDGPERTGLYRLDDRDGDGVYESTELVRATDGGMGEHGPHAILLGPDGRLYYNNGNHAHLKPPIDAHSPVNVAYEGELLPHYNDARGHAAGIVAPGGEIYRSDDDGKTWSRAVAGFRNEYDFAFNRDGEIFSFDSDMEWGLGLPWYRPVRICHGAIGAEFGWRNGSGKWPAYYFDSLPSALDVGRGSPTGVAFYQAHQFPQEYDDQFLVCDWSQGRILAVALRRTGATYTGKATELVSGQPLNCTDIDVGPDGAVYFTTGGRGTQGGLYRVASSRQVKFETPTDPIEQAIAIDSPLASFSQARLAKLREQAGERWGEGLVRIARDSSAPDRRRVRALDLLTQFGPEPDDDLLTSLQADSKVLVRGKAVALLGLRHSEMRQQALMKALEDDDPFVLRLACEALLRSGGPIPVEKVIPLLADRDRWVRYAARIAIEHADPSPHRQALLAAKEPRPLLEGMLAVVRATKLDNDAQADLLDRELALLSQQLEADERLDLLRLIGLTYLLGPQQPGALSVSNRIAEKLLAALPGPAGPVRRETARLLAYLAGPHAPRVVSALLDLQKNEPNRATQIHYAYCLRAIPDGWSAAQKRQLWAWYEEASRWDGGFSFLGYLDFMIQNLVALFSREERLAFLKQGERFPFPTRILVRSIDLNQSPELIGAVATLYPRLRQSTNPAQAGELQAMILSTLGQSRRAEGRAVLRSLYQSDPAHRDLIARALADHPTADDLPILAAALRSRDPNTTGILLAALRQLDARPEGPDALRSLILLARRAGPPMQHDLDTLGKTWFPDAGMPEKADFAQSLQFWEKFYTERFPNGPALVSSSRSESQRSYSLDELRPLLALASRRTASPERGKLVLKKARCLDCHKFGSSGQGLGPDLTTVSSRFRPVEILESIIDPSKVISDQYRPMQVATTDGKLYSGMPTAGDADKLVLLLSDGTKVTIPKAEVEERKESKVSVMPEGLINTLSLQEIGDLLALFESMPRVEQPGKK